VLTFPLGWGEVGSDRAPTDFGKFVAIQLDKDQLSDRDIQSAVKGVLGMMRFANHDNPLLLEALGDLLNEGRSPGPDAGRLAARAYLQASYRFEDPPIQDRFRLRAQEVLQHHSGIKPQEAESALAEVEQDFSMERADADAWYAKLKAKEVSWIAEGADADAEFDQFYDYDPHVRGNNPDSRRTSSQDWQEPGTNSSVGVSLAKILLSILALVGFVWLVTHRRASPDVSATRPS
jgi:hypothetical protein